MLPLAAVFVMAPFSFNADEAAAPPVNVVAAPKLSGCSRFESGLSYSPSRLRRR
jgi:hypothetical protein